MVRRKIFNLVLIACFSFRITAIQTFGQNDPFFSQRRRLQEDTSPENDSAAQESDLNSSKDAVAEVSDQAKEGTTAPAPEEQVAEQQKEETQSEEGTAKLETGTTTNEPETIASQQSKCADATGCEECKIQVESASPCKWNGNECVEVEESDALSSAAKMCEQSEQQEVIMETQQTIEEVKNEAEMVDQNSKPVSEEQPQQQCADALECEACISMVEAQSPCAWIEKKCVNGQQSNAIDNTNANICQEAKEQTTTPMNDTTDGNVNEAGKVGTTTTNSFSDEYYDDESGSTFAAVAFFMATALIGGGVYWFKQLKNNGDSKDGGSSNSEFGIPKKGGKGFANSETVPLAATDDDEEWGWEDNSQRQNDGDVELIGTKKEDHDLTRAFAMQSTGLPRNISAQPQNISKRSSPIVSRTKKTPAMSNFPSAATTTAAPTVPSLKITSLGKSSSVPKKPIKKKNTDDDLFASMGLSAKPTFSQNKPKVESKSSVTTSKLSTLATTDLGNADWDDDGDLDDLLND